MHFFFILVYSAAKTNSSFSPSRPCTLYLHLEQRFLSARIRAIDNSYISNRDSRRIIPSMHKRWLLRAKQIVLCYINHKYNVIVILVFVVRMIDIIYILANYVGSYPVAYNSVPAVTTPSDYTYQPPVHMVPTYYPPGQPAMQPPPVMYHRVPTPPNTPTSNQVINGQYQFRA